MRRVQQDSAHRTRSAQGRHRGLARSSGGPSPSGCWRSQQLRLRPRWNRSRGGVEHGLRRLGLSNNALATLPTGSFAGVEGLREVSVEGNQAHPSPSRWNWRDWTPNLGVPSPAQLVARCHHPPRNPCKAATNWACRWHRWSKRRNPLDERRWQATSSDEVLATVSIIDGSLVVAPRAGQRRNGRGHAGRHRHRRLLDNAVP